MENRLQKPKDPTATEITKDTAEEKQQSTLNVEVKKADTISENADQIISSASKKIYTSKDVGSAQRPMQSKDNSVRDSKHRSTNSDVKPQRTYQQQSSMKRPNSRLMTEGDLADMQTNELMFVAKRLGIIGSS